MTDLSTLDLFTPVKVSWIDCHYTEPGWTDIDSFDFDEHTRASKQMVSVGQVIHVDDSNLFLSCTVGKETRSMLDCTSIPIVSILSVEVI